MLHESVSKLVGGLSHDGGALRHENEANKRGKQSSNVPNKDDGNPNPAPSWGEVEAVLHVQGNTVTKSSTDWGGCPFCR